MKFWAGLCALFILLIVIFVDTDHLGILHVVYDFSYGDKAGHFVLFGLLSLTVNLAVFEARPSQDRKSLAIKACLVLAVLMALEEFSQIWIPARSFDLLDLTAGYLGVALGAWLAILLEKRKSNPLKPGQ